MMRRFLRSLIHRLSSASAAVAIREMVTASGRPRSSRTSAGSASSGARLPSTIAQKAGVFGGGASESKPERSSWAR
jgi:hypothetical protein